MSIVVDNASKQKPQLMTNNSELIHSATKTLQEDPKTAVSQKAKRDKQNARNIAVVDKKQEPVVPIKRPKPTQEMKLKNGNNKIQRYIKLKITNSKIKK